MNILITVCGRAGSKGVKNKNFKNFLGNPLIEYTFASINLFKEQNKSLNIDVCLNSDSKELLKIATNNSIKGIDRPEELAQDNSPKVPVIRYSLEYMESFYKKKYDYVIDLDITSPLRKVEDIENALNKAISNKEIDVVYSVVNSRRNPYFNMVENKNGEIKKIKESNFIRRQDAPKVYDMNASIYCYKRDSLINVLKKSPLEGKNDIVVMKDTAVLDIDSEEDFELMEVLGKYFLENEFKELKNYLIRF